MTPTAPDIPEITLPVSYHRKARPDEIGLFGINSVDKETDAQGRDVGGKSPLDSKGGRLVFYGAITYSLGSLAYITGSLAIQYLKRKFGGHGR